ncbi:MAG TPA: hypothetical protein VGC55_00905 [Dokdonella sp.]
MATFDISSKAGHVERITVRVPDGAVYVLDRFVRQAAALADEKRRFAIGARPQENVDLDETALKQTCAWAENARAFSRVTRLEAGKSVVLWSNPKGGLRLDAGVNSNTGLRGECVSPDGRFLSIVEGVEGDPDPQTPAIVELRRSLPKIPFVGRKSGKTYGQDRYFLFVGWQPGAPHTLQFNYGGDGQDIDDDALPRASPPKR